MYDTSSRFIARTIIVVLAIALLACQDGSENNAEIADENAWLVAGPIIDPDLEIVGQVAVAYAQRILRETGTHNQLELENENVDLKVRRALYRGEEPPVTVGAKMPLSIRVIISGGTGAGGAEHWPVYATRSTKSGDGSGNSLGEQITLELAFEDGSKIRACVALRPRNLVKLERGPTFAIDPIWGVVRPPSLGADAKTK